MLREVGISGALAPSLLIYFLVAIPTFLVLDLPLSRLGLYRLLWHPPLARFALFVCLFYGLTRLPWF
jgi:protein AaeX